MLAQQCMKHTNLITDTYLHSSVLSQQSTMGG